MDEPDTPIDASIDPTDPIAGYHALTCSAPGAADPAFEWLAEGSAIGAGPVLPASATRGHRTVACRVVDGGREAVARVSPRVAGGNLLVLLADDLGRERLAPEGVSIGPHAVTPNLDALAARSLRFENAWAMPVCSPTRAALLTGRLPRQTGVGDIIDAPSRHPLADGEVFLPQVLAVAPEPRQSALIGKWHLNARDVGSAELQPGVAGFDWWRGTNGNLTTHFDPLEPPRGYEHWEANVDGVLSERTDYATAAVANDAIDALATLEPPWFLYVAFQAMHEPWHTPPPEWRYSEPGSSPPGMQRKSELMLESLDIAVGEILGAMTEEQIATTTVVFLGDNGTMYTVVTEPFASGRAKGTVYQGGVGVPFWVSGPLVAEPGGATPALVNAADVFDTALALAGVPPGQADALLGGDQVTRYSTSFLPVLADPQTADARAYNFTEKFSPNGPPPTDGFQLAVRDRRFKLLERGNREDFARELYDLEADPFEAVNLLDAELSADAQAAWDDLAAELARIEATYVFDADRTPRGQPSGASVRAPTGAQR